MNFERHYLRSISLRKEKELPLTAYPFDLPAVKYLKQIDLAPEVTFLVGENGTGKSTLMEAMAIASGFNAEGGSKNFRFNTRSTHSELHEYICLSRGANRPKDGYFLRAESYYNVATNIDELDEDPENFGPPIKDSYGGKSLHEQSHGESFLSLFKHRLIGKGLYFLDEPEASLSPQKQMAILVRMNELINQQSQFVIATHSPILMSYPGAKIIQLTANGYETVSFSQTEHFQLYQMFLNHPEMMLNKLGIQE